VPANLLVTVNTLADDPAGATAGLVTLRDAINLVNGDAGDVASSPDTIAFALPGTISLAADLPAITNPVLLDGSSQTGVTVDGRASTGVNGYEGYAVLVVNSAATVNGVTFTNGVLTVNTGSVLSVPGNLTLGDPAGDSTLAQIFGILSVTGDLSLGDNGTLNNGVSSTDQAICTVGGNFNVGVDGSVNNYGHSTLSVTGNLAMADGGALTNGTEFPSGQTAKLQIGGSLSFGSFGSINNNGASVLSVTNNVTFGTFGSVDNGQVHADAVTFTVGGSLSLGAGSSVYNWGTSVLTLAGGFTLGKSGFVFNGGNSADAAMLNVGGDLTVGASGGSGTFVANKGASKLTVNGNFTLHGTSPFVDNGTASTDSATLTAGGNFALDAKSNFYDNGTSTFTVSGSFTLGAGSYFVDNGTMSVGGPFDPGSAATASNDIVAGTFNANANSSVTTDAATWNVLAGGVLNLAAGATFTVAPGGSLKDAGTFTGQTGSSVAVNLATFEVLASGHLVVDGSLDVAAGSTLQVDGGIVTSVTVTAGGSGYSSPPVVSFAGNGSGAAGVAKISGGVVAVNLTSAGSGYLAAYVILSGTGTGATATATVSDGVVTGVTITNPGSGYTAPPSVTIYDPFGTGSGASGLATINGAVTSVTLTNPGSGYTAPPMISFAGDGTGAAATATIDTSHHGVVTDRGTLTVEGTLVASKLSAVVVDENGNLTASGTGQLNIQGTLLQWNNPADIPSGTALGPAQLDASATTMVGGSFVSLPGTFSYSPPSGTVLPVGAGQLLSVTFTPSDTANYAGASAQALINVLASKVNPVTPTITVNVVNITYGTALANSQLSGTATVSGKAVSGTFTFTDPSAAGTILNAGNGQSEAVTFSPDDTTDYTAASGTVVINVGRADQTITVTQGAPATGVYGSTFTVSATASSGLPVTIGASGAGTLSSGGNGSATVQITSGSGAAAVAFSQAGNANYNPATVVEEDVSAQKANQVITVTQAAPAGALYGASFSVAATASSGLPVTIAASGAGTVSSGGSASATVQMTSGTGATAVTFSQSGNANFNPATVVEEDVTAQKANQVITVTKPAPVSAVYGASFGVAATASSGLPVAIAAGGSGTVSSGGSASATVQMTSGTGPAAVTFSQSGNANYNAATVVEEDVTAQKASQVITVTQAAPASAVYGTSFGVAATASSGLPVTINASGAGIVSSGGSGSATVQMTSGTGTAVVTFAQAGNANYNAATVVVENVAAQKASQTLSVTQAPPAFAIEGAKFIVAASASSGLPVAIVAAGAASGADWNTAPITITSASGFGVIAVFQPGNANYAPVATAFLVQIVSPGVTVLGSELWYVGIDTTPGRADNQVKIDPVGRSRTGSTGLNINGVSYYRSFAAIRIFGYNGNDNIRLARDLTLPVVIVDGNGYDHIEAGDNNNWITLGNGNDTVKLGDGNNTLTLGNGNDTVRLGDGSNVVVTGNGTNTIEVGNGPNLVVAGLGVHNVKAGNGSNILVDGSVQLTQSGDSLRQVLGDWIVHGKSTSNVACIRSRLAVTYNRTYANTLKAGSGLDWFWYLYGWDIINRKSTDVLD
jgi:hypothetical protein